MLARDLDGLRFGEAVDAYERGRPTYPAAIADWLLDEQPTRVVDLGAGSGKFTRLLVERVAEVIAVEPDAGMRRALAAGVPGASVLAGSGENIPLRDGYVDAVFAAQAWHWVDPVRASLEVARVLRPGGWLGTIWNRRDREDPWVAELLDMLDEYDAAPPTDGEGVFGPPFGEIETMSMRWVHELDVDGVIAMVTSFAPVIRLSDETQAEILGRARAIAIAGADDRGLVAIPYFTRGYRTRRP